MDYAAYEEQRAQLMQAEKNLQRELNKTDFDSTEDTDVRAKLTKVRERLVELEAQKDALRLEAPASEASRPDSIGRDAFGDVHGDVNTWNVYHNAAPPDETPETPERYLQALVEKCRYISLAEIHPKMMTGDHQEQRPTLDALYTTLLTTASAQEQRSKRPDKQEIEKA
ncbi:MAG: hypothetical protein GY794_22875, partial [bacterium]|nr:hypothetical protein [bacterium]